MTTLHCKRSLLKSYIIYLCLSIAGLVFFVYQYISAVLSSQTSVWSFFSLMMTILLALFVLLFVYSINAWRTYQLEFYETFLEIQYPRLTLARPFKCAYSDIVSVWKPLAGYIQLVSREGKKLDIAVSLFEGGDAHVFDLLTQYIPVECFEKDLRNNYKKRDPIQLVISFLQVFVALLGLVFTMFANSSMFGLPIPWLNSWNYVSPSPTPILILGASIAVPDSIWVTGPDSDIFSKRHILQLVTGGQIKTWVLPEEIDFGTKRIIVDSHQQPVLITYDELYFLDAGKWKKLNIASRSLFFDDITVFGNEFWGLTGVGEPTMIHIQADRLTPERVILQNPVTQKPLAPSEIVAADDGTTLLLDNSTADASVIYLLHNGEVQNQFYPVNVKDRCYIVDFALSPDHDMYVLLNCGESFVEKIDIQGNQTFTKLPESLSDEDSSYKNRYQAIQVDTRGRLWAQGGFFPRFIKVLEPVWDGAAHELVQYDEHNSNYGSGSTDSFIRTSDGRMWAGGYHLMWMDSNAAILPTPLPSWLVEIHKIAHWIGIGLFGLSSLFSMLILIRMRMKKPRNR